MKSTKSQVLELRQTILDRRKSLSPDQAKALSGQICHRWLSLVEHLKWEGLKVGAYRVSDSTKDELNLSECLMVLRSKGAVICYPRMLEGAALQFHVMASDSGPWARGSFGIEEPPRDTQAVSAGALDVVLIPGVVFGPKGQRVGRGKGYYDRLLPNCAQALRVALAFDLQMVDTAEVPQSDWDQSMDWIVTESREFRPDTSKNGRFCQWFSFRGWHTPKTS